MSIPHFRPNFGQDEVEAVTSVLLSQHIAQGSQVQMLENALCQILGLKHCVVVSSGTIALSLALRALQVHAGDEVILPSYTCAALWQAIKFIGAEPVFGDIESETFNLDPMVVKNLLHRATKAIIFPHMFGQPGYIREVFPNDVPVIEDIAQAVGAKIDGQPVGGFGTLTVGSFYATKVIGAGEGGFVVSNAEHYIESIRDWRDYDERENLVLRYNAKMSDLEAAIALEQLRKLDINLRRRQEHGATYRQILEAALVIPANNPHLIANHYRCIGQIPGQASEAIIARAQVSGIQLRRPVFKPLHLYQPTTSLPNTERAWKEQFSIPVFPALQDAEHRQICAFLKEVTEK